MLNCTPFMVVVEASSALGVNGSRGIAVDDAVAVWPKSCAERMETLFRLPRHPVLDGPRCAGVGRALQYFPQRSGEARLFVQEHGRELSCRAW